MIYSISYIQSMNQPLDDIDRDILRILQGEGRIPNSRLAARVHLSESPCLRRVKALEERGVIERYAAVLRPEALGYDGTVFVHVALQRQGEADLSAFERAVEEIPEVVECYLMSGDFDYLLRVVVRDMADFERIHGEKLTRLPGVARVQSSFALRGVKRAGSLPVPGEDA